MVPQNKEIFEDLAGEERRAPSHLLPQCLPFFCHCWGPSSWTGLICGGSFLGVYLNTPFCRPDQKTRCSPPPGQLLGLGFCAACYQLPTLTPDPSLAPAEGRGHLRPTGWSGAHKLCTPLFLGISDQAKEPGTGKPERQKHPRVRQPPMAFPGACSQLRAMQIKVAANAPRILLTNEWHKFLF